MRDDYSTAMRIQCCSLNTEESYFIGENETYGMLHNQEANEGQVLTAWLINTLCEWNVKSPRCKAFIY